MSEQVLLIVEKEAALDPNLEALVVRLARDYQLDAATARHRLLGHGLTMLAKGVPDKLEPLAALLAEYRLRCWTIRPTAPTFSPVRIRDLAIGADVITMSGPKGEVILPRGARVLAVLGDLTGRAAERCRKQMIGQHLYLGSSGAIPVDEQKLYRTVLQNMPVLDLYRLSPEGRVEATARFFAGRFNPKGLGERATISAVGNLDQIVRLVREYAADFTLRIDFGFGQIPGVRLRTPQPAAAGKGDESVPSPLKTGTGDPQIQRENLLSLTRFGWLAADLLRQRPEEGDATVAPELLAATAVLQQPALAAVGGAGADSVLTGLAEVQEALREEPRPPDRPVRTHTALPPPPERQGHGRGGLTLAGNVAAVIAAGMVIAFKNGTDLLPAVERYGLRTGVLPAILSLALFWGSFYYLRLKRLVENTPTSKTRSLAMGLVELKGKTVRQYALVSPLTHIPCAYYRLRTYRRGHKGHWKLVSDSDSSHVPFFLEDETGRVPIDPAGARVVPRTRRSDGDSGRWNMLLDSPLGASGNEKTVEEIIFEGSDLYVLGFARPARARRCSLRERTVEALRHLKSDRQALRRFDADGDGQISEAEWETARSTVEREVLEESLAEEQSRHVRAPLAVVGRPPGRSLPFVLTEVESELHLTRRYTLLSVPLLLAALAAAVWAMYTVLQRIMSQ